MRFYSMQKPWRIFGISYSYFKKTLSVFFRSASEITIVSCLDCLFELATPRGEIGAWLFLTVAEEGTGIEYFTF